MVVIFRFSLETEKAALMPPTSPCLSPRVTNTNQQQCSKLNLHQSSPEQCRDHSSNISIRRMKPQHARFDTETHHYFSPNEFQTSMGLRKKMHDIYVLPVSPTLSSSSSTTNADEVTKSNSNPTSIQSRRHQSSSSSNKTHQNDTCQGVNNACFTDSPQIKYRTLPRLQTDTLRRVPAPSQPPPLPPVDEKLSLSIDEIPTKRTHPPPVPSRSQKPLTIPIHFEEHTKQSNAIDFSLSTDSSPTNDDSIHAWPNPPESMSTSRLSRPLSIPYDHLLTSNPIIHLNSTNNYFPSYEHSMLTESNT